MFHDFFNWLKEDLGRFGADGQSWSNQLQESLFMWNIVEATHVMSIMFFAGTIWIVDLRMMGLAFKNLPFSKLNDRVLPITTISFAAMIVTGFIAFIGRDPLMYYHDIWFRLKMLFLIAATINILWFHNRVQKNQAEWDALQSPPLKVKLSGAVSMTSWFLIIILGRFIAYDWYKCEKASPNSVVYMMQECKQALWYLDEQPEDDSNTPKPASTLEQAAPAETD